MIYFALPNRLDNADPSNDRGGLTGDRLRPGYDPTAKSFYNGGDLKGLMRRLAYIQSLGATAIWVGPVFKNKPVQGALGHESVSYQGYYITNSNHTADVIQYRECGACVHRSRADFPYRRRRGVKGAAINLGFAGDDVRIAANSAKLTDPTYAYTPFLAKGDEHAKSPDWLNDIRLYHNRGSTTFENERSTMGGFVGLDDLMTENPRVVAGMIDIFGGYIDRFGVCGYRIATGHHVNPEFWQAFVPAMLARAKAKGIPNFHIFGEVSHGSVDPGALAEHTRVDKLPAVLDFAFRQAVIETVAGTRGSDAFVVLFRRDALYEGGGDAAQELPTFISNHDNGRSAFYVRQAFPQAGDDEVMRRVMLGNAMLLSLGGVPTIYSGDEQGFVGHGNDQDAREDMFASRVESYNDNRLLGTKTTTATAHFGQENPLFKQNAALARLRVATPALTRGWQVLRARAEKPGLLAISCFDLTSNAEVLLAFDPSGMPVKRLIEGEPGAATTRVLTGSACAARVAALGSLRVTLPAFGYAVCAWGTK